MEKIDLNKEYWPEDDPSWVEKLQDICKDDRLFREALEYGPVLIAEDGWLVWAHKDGSRVKHKWIGKNIKVERKVWKIR